MCEPGRYKLVYQVPLLFILLIWLRAKNFYSIFTPFLRGVMGRYGVLHHSRFLKNVAISRVIWFCDILQRYKKIGKNSRYLISFYYSPYGFCSICKGFWRFLDRLSIRQWRINESFSLFKLCANSFCMFYFFIEKWAYYHILIITQNIKILKRFK